MAEPQQSETGETENVERIARHKLPTGALDVAISADAKSAYAACLDGVYEVELDSGDQRQLLQHESYASGVVLLPDRQVLVSAGFDGWLKWFDLESHQLIRQVQAHKFWSWQLAHSPDGQYIASVTGQYLAGGIKYEPAAEQEPSVRVYDAQTGEPRYQLSHVPSVQAVAISPDSRYLAAGNLMGEIRIWDLATGERLAQWTTGAFTSWGIIKSHCYIGGVFALRFTADAEHLLLAGMGPMRDPMAGNGRQLWQRYAWQDDPARLTDQTHEGESGQGLMETLALHPSGQVFLMGGRLRSGKWNAALFSTATGAIRHSFNSGHRITGAEFSADGDRLVTSGSFKQPKPKNGVIAPFGAVDLYRVADRQQPSGA